MKIVMINALPFGSTGRIMFGIAETARKGGNEVYTFCKSVKSDRNNYGNHSYIGTIKQINITSRLSAYTGLEGVFSKTATKKLLRRLDEIKPDIIHLHNLHGWYINFELLFNYVKTNNIKTVWTLHDCWAFTGHCPHFEMIGCNKWKTGCFGCPQYREYPQSKIDRSKKMYELKKRWFTGVKDLTIVTPSQWLADLVKQSFLKEYPVKVINNGIDLEVFKPTVSDFRKKHNIPENKKIILGVAFGWGIKKGLDVFVELSKRLDDRFQIVLVGTDDNVDKQLPKNIISIHCTQNQKELAEIYTAADLFFNPTKEEVLGLVNIEALACGTPVITFDSGGSPECVDENCGVVVSKNKIDDLLEKIRLICFDNPYTKEACFEKSQQFDKNERFNDYVKLYEKLSEEYKI